MEFPSFMRGPRWTVCLSAIVLGAASILLFWQLGGTPLEDYDEATYAEVARHVVDRVGQPIYGFFRWNMTEDGVKIPVAWFEKPPLVLWMMAVSMWFGGMSEWAARLPSAFLGWCAVAVTFLFGWRLSGRAGGGFWAGVILLGNASFLSWSREARLDSAVTCTTVLAVWALWEWARRQRQGWLTVFWLSIALGFMVKHVVGILPLFFAPIILFLYDRKRLGAFFRPRQHLIGVLCAAGIVLPWHLLMWRAYGTDFLQGYFLDATLDRVGKNVLGGRASSPFFYVRHMLQSLMVWLGGLCAIFGAVLGRWVWLRRRPADVCRAPVLLFSVLPAAGMFLLFSLMSTKLGPYVMPTFPFFAVAAGYGIVWLWRHAPGVAGNWGRAVIVVALVPWLVFLLSDAVQYGWKWKRHIRVHLDGFTVQDVYNDERAIGELIAIHNDPAYTYLWSQMETITYYADRPIRYLPKETEVDVPIGALVVVPNMVLGDVTAQPARVLYYGKALSLIRAEWTH